MLQQTKVAGSLTDWLAEYRDLIVQSYTSAYTHITDRGVAWNYDIFHKLKWLKFKSLTSIFIRVENV